MLSFRSAESGRSAVALELGCCHDETATATKLSYEEDDTLLLMALESGLFAANSNAKKISTVDDSSVRSTEASPLPPRQPKPVEDHPTAVTRTTAVDNTVKSQKFKFWRS